VKREDIRYIGIDSSMGMIEKASARCAGDQRAMFLAEDAMTYPFEKYSMIISYYTLQFIRPRERQLIFDRCYDALEWGGAFILFEKVRAPDARFQDIMMQVYQEYKLQRHFSEAEIVQKQRSLKGTMEPFSTEGNKALMQRAGFVDIMNIMKWVCFEGFLAIK
jgi:tRNA (cmo5U34)-methyltransferase